MAAASVHDQNVHNLHPARPIIQDRKNELLPMEGGEGVEEHVAEEEEAQAPR